MKTLSFVLAATFVLSSFAFARDHKHAPGVSRRQHNQAHRIKQGIRSGKLTRDEVKGLREEQKAIRQQKIEAKSDGVVTKEERKELHEAQNAASKNIYEQKHDGENRKGKKPAAPPAEAAPVEAPATE